MADTKEVIELRNALTDARNAVAYAESQTEQMQQKWAISEKGLKAEIDDIKVNLEFWKKQAEIERKNMAEANGQRQMIREQASVLEDKLEQVQRDHAATTHELGLARGRLEGYKEAVAEVIKWRIETHGR